MSQLPSIPTAVGVVSPLKSVMKSPESGQIQAGSTAGAELTPFHEALQQTLQEAEEQTDAVLGWLAAFQLDQPVAPQVLDTGRFLPFNPTADGKPLPFAQALVLQTGNPTLQPQTELFKPGMGGELQPQFLMDRFMAGKGGELSLPAVAAQGLLKGTEMRAGAEFAGQFSTLMSQTVPGGATVKPSMPLLPVDVPVAQPGWDKAMGERIQWMLGRQLQQAEVKLTPPHLGPLEIRISIHQDQASVSFLAAQAPTREALEAAMPRLREMLGDVNLNLANVDVGHRGGSESRPDQAAGSATPGHAGVDDTAGDADQIASGAGRVVSRGLVDHYV